MDVDLPVFDLASMLGMCADTQHQIDMRSLARTLVRFLDAKGLLARRSWDPAKELPDDLLIRESELTAEGKALFYAVVIDKWLARYDRTLDATDDRVLRKGLEKLRATKGSGKRR